MSEEYFARGALTVLQSDKQDAQIQSELMDLLGMEAFELISELLANRRAFKSVKPVQLAPAAVGKGGAGGGAGGSGEGKQGSGKTGLSNADKKRFAKMSASVTTNPGLLNPLLAQVTGKQAALIHSLDHMKASGEDPSMKLATAAASLPEGTIRTRHKDYTEVAIPAPVREAVPEDQLVPLSAFDEIVQPALRGIKRLNQLQSKVFECAYKTNTNMLVCAPTGAGKTNVALMTVLREVMNNVEGDRINKRDFKIVYVAPMKALAQEVTEKFSKMLEPLGLLVRELTGDTQLTKKEVVETQMIVTTPEKWDVMTRKSGDGSLIQMVRLLIIDEVHLLHEDRGPVIEVLVARTLRNVESSQQLCRVVGLSATLPNYKDVAEFLAVNEKKGLFFFDARFRPVPLEQSYIGVHEPNQMRRIQRMNEIAYDKTIESCKKTNQVLVFVHSRRETVKLAQFFRDRAVEKQDMMHIDTREVQGYEGYIQKLTRATRNAELIDLVKSGFGVHHAGMTRAERSFVEDAFHKGIITVLVCTATLAWGVNLPAHTVVLKGTQIYEPKRGGWVDVGMLDVMQIFGRAGRPQFDTSGEAILITSQDKLHHYLNLLTAQMPIESQFIQSLPDHLNAEIILGTVTNIREAEEWLKYTYLYVRMRKNPMAYGVPYEDLLMDPALVGRRRELLINSAKELMACRMVKFDAQSGNFSSTDVGRVASLYYIHHRSVDTYNSMLKPHMSDEEVITLISNSREFSQLKIRDEEMGELTKIMHKYVSCVCHVTFLPSSCYYLL